MQKLLWLLFVLLSSSAFATTEHDNNVCISGGWDSVTFSTTTKKDTDKYFITASQPFSGIDPKNQPSEKNCVRIRAGRKNSAAVMKWVNTQNKRILGWDFDSTDEVPMPIPARYYQGTGYIRPTQANFAVIVDMILKKKNAVIVDGMNLISKDLVITCLDVIFVQTGNYNPPKENLIDGNVWMIYDNNEYSLICKDQDGRHVKLKASHGAMTHRDANPVRAISISNEDDSNDEVSAFASASSNNVIRLEVAK